MCGIAGFIHLNNQSVEGGSKILTCMGELLAHRGPDGEGSWLDDSGKVGLAHRRLAIIDLSSSGAQPMKGRDGTLITLNGEIYNYLELQESLSGSWNFSSDSDTETVLASYDRYEEECVDHLRGMFSFAIWDDRKQRLFCARDRFGIKPFYYATVDDVFYFASEAKALLPVLPDADYIAGHRVKIPQPYHPPHLLLFLSLCCRSFRESLLLIAVVRLSLTRICVSSIVHFFLWGKNGEVWCGIW